MDMERPVRFWMVLGLAALLAALPQVALAGPPLLCWPFLIDDAESLPWGTGPGWRTASASYDGKRLITDTLALLTPDTPVIVRMETLRRATVYAVENEALARELKAQLIARAEMSDARGRPDALAWFDAGYLVETYKQTSVMHHVKAVVAGENGYAWVVKAIKLRGGDAEMEFAAALMTFGRLNRDKQREHVQRALAGASDGSLLARNLVAHAELFGAHVTTLAELRTHVNGGD